MQFLVDGGVYMTVRKGTPPRTTRTSAESGSSGGLQRGSRSRPVSLNGPLEGTTAVIHGRRVRLVLMSHPAEYAGSRVSGTQVSRRARRIQLVTATCGRIIGCSQIGGLLRRPTAAGASVVRGCRWNEWQG
jgi:hypothetical protein